MNKFDTEFKRNKLYLLLKELEIKQATLNTDEEIWEFADMGDYRYRLFHSGEYPAEFIIQQEKDKCPICDTKLTDQDKRGSDDYKEYTVEDYYCPKCHFKGSQWFNPVFSGHTSQTEMQIEQIRKQYNQNK